LVTKLSEVLQYLWVTGNDSWNGNSGNNWQHSHHPPPWNNRPGYWTHNKNEGGRFPPPNNTSNFDHNRGDYILNVDNMIGTHESVTFVPTEIYTAPN
jgi:hypothetical protein